MISSDSAWGGGDLVFGRNQLRRGLVFPGQDRFQQGLVFVESTPTGRQMQHGLPPGVPQGRISLSCKSVSYVCGGSVGNPWLTWSRASQPGGKQRPPARGARQVHVARPEPRSFRAARMPPSTAGRMPAATACNKLRCARFRAERAAGPRTSSASAPALRAPSPPCPMGERDGGRRRLSNSQRRFQTGGSAEDCHPVARARVACKARSGPRTPKPAQLRAG